jgi:hypothetical protein
VVAVIGVLVWASHHDRALRQNIVEVVRGESRAEVEEILGNPTNAAACGSATAATAGCNLEYQYRYYLHFWHHEYEIIWLDKDGRVLGGQHVASSL